jgi:hypothetical protein
MEGFIGLLRLNLVISGLKESVFNISFYYFKLYDFYHPSSHQLAHSERSVIIILTPQGRKQILLEASFSLMNLHFKDGYILF